MSELQNQLCSGTLKLNRRTFIPDNGFKTIIFLILVLLTSSLWSQSVEDCLNKTLEAHLSESGLPGTSLALVDVEGIYFVSGFGLADKRTSAKFTPTTVHNWGSVSKTVVGVALAKAIEGGYLTMDTAINEVLPFEVKNPYHPDSPILVRHLANHTSSIQDSKFYSETYIPNPQLTSSPDAHPGFKSFLESHKPMSQKDFLFNILSDEGGKYRKKNYLKAPPGTQKSYANLNAALMALILEESTGVPFKTYTQEMIFEPLGMKSTTWDAAALKTDRLATPYFPAGSEVPMYKLITYPDGGLYSSVSDMALYLLEMIRAYKGKSTYLTPEFASLVFPGDGDGDRAFWGMNETTRIMGHQGSDPGAQADIRFHADTGLGSVLLTNVNAEDQEELWEEVRGIYEIVTAFENGSKTEGCKE